MANSLTYHPELFKTGYVDTLQKNVQLFNESVDNTITLAAKNAQGVIEKEKFFSITSDAVQRTTRGDFSDATVHSLNENQIERAYMDGLFGPFELGELERLADGRSPEAFNEFLGQQAAELVFEDYAESLFSALAGSIESEGSLVYRHEDGGGNLQNITAESINEALNKFGDQRKDLSLIIMHSAVEKDLISDAISGADPEVEYGAIQGRPATLGLPYITADLDALSLSGSGYRTIIVRDGGGMVEEIDQPELERTDNRFKKAGVTQKWGADYRFNVKSQGFSYTGPDNPTQSDLADTSNWSFEYNDVKGASGVVLKTS